MKRFAILVPLFLPLAAQAQDQNGRFRYLGIADDFAVMASAPEGPENARKLALVAVNRKPSGPGGADAIWTEIIVDCPARTNQMAWSVLYLGDKELRRWEGPGARMPPRPGTPYALIQEFACTDWQPSGEPVWVEGEETARRYARERLTAE